MCGWKCQVLGRERWKSRVKNAKKLSFSREIRAAVPILPCNDRSPLLHIFDPNYLSFHLKCPRKCQKSVILKFFQHFPKFVALPISNFGMNHKFHHSARCILSKLDYAKFNVSNRCSFKRYRRKTLTGGGVCSTPSLPW